MRPAVRPAEASGARPAPNFFKRRRPGETISQSITMFKLAQVGLELSSGRGIWVGAQVGRIFRLPVFFGSQIAFIELYI
jgi:hypothetical protein